MEDLALNYRLAVKHINAQSSKAKNSNSKIAQRVVLETGQMQQMETYLCNLC